MGGQGIPPVPGEMGVQHQAQGSPWAMRNGFGDARWLCAHMGGTPSFSGASCLATARGLALVRGVALAMPPMLARSSLCLSSLPCRGHLSCSGRHCQRLGCLVSASFPLA